MSIKTKSKLLKFLLTSGPLILLYISVLNELDLNYLNYKYFSFNFPFILIFFFTLKEFKHFDYLLVFLAGLFNDIVVGLPLGISSLSYSLLCVATAYIRNITIRPNPVKDWFYFLFIISLINSLNYSILILFFSFDLDLMSYLINNFFTFLLYIFFVSLFKLYMKGLND